MRLLQSEVGWPKAITLCGAYLLFVIASEQEVAPQAEKTGDEASPQEDPASI